MKKIIPLVFMVLLLVGCIGNKQSLKEKLEVIEGREQKIEDAKIEDLKSEESTEEEWDVYVERPNLEGQSVEVLMKSMTIEEKVAQLFVVDFYSYNQYNEVTQMTSGLNSRLKEYPVGGVIFFGKNIVNKDQVSGLIEDLQKSSDYPLFVSIDEEGGLVSRLQNNAGMGMTITPSASIIGSTEDAENAYQVGKVLGLELNALGFNMNFAPVADVNTNPDNKVIGDRAFSSDPLIVGEMVVQEAKGLEEQGVAAVAKHFPGHGDTSTDTHTGAVFVEHDRERLVKIELVPFQKVIDNNISGIMVAHIALPNVTGTEEPASLSQEVITQVLREDMQYDGIVITDALNMGAISDLYESDEACVKALQAGVDILLMPADFELGYQGVLKALSEGNLTMERIDQSVARILSLKIRLGLFKFDEPRQPLSVIGSKEHVDMIRAISE